METRYWKCNNDLGQLCCKVTEETPGAVKYEHSMCTNGFKWQLQVPRLAGHIESLYLDDGPYGQHLCIGLQNSAGVDVLQVPTHKQNSDWPVPAYAYLAKRVCNFDINRMLELKVWKFKPENSDYDKLFILPYQGGIKPVAEALTREKQPKLEPVMVGSKKVWNTEPLFKALEEQVEAFIVANKGKLDEAKAAREPTENEKAAAQSTDLLADCPF